MTVCKKLCIHCTPALARYPEFLRLSKSLLLAAGELVEDGVVCGGLIVSLTGPNYSPLGPHNQKQFKTLLS